MVRHGVGQLKHLITRALWAHWIVQLESIAVRRISRVVNTASCLASCEPSKDLSSVGRGQERALKKLRCSFVQNETCAFPLRKDGPCLSSARLCKSKNNLWMDGLLCEERVNGSPFSGTLEAHFSCLFYVPHERLLTKFCILVRSTSSSHKNQVTQIHELYA